VFWVLHCVLVGFLLVAMVRSVNCGFWRTSGRFRGTFGGGSLAFGFFFRFGV